MKIRIQFPEEMSKFSPVAHERRLEHIDDILLWAMESDMYAEFYSSHYERTPTHKFVGAWAVFTVEPENMVMFMLRWGARLHKDRKKND